MPGKKPELPVVTFFFLKWCFQCLSTEGRGGGGFCKVLSFRVTY